MTEDYDKKGTALERRELARELAELVPISTEESTSVWRHFPCQVAISGIAHLFS